MINLRRKSANVNDEGVKKLRLRLWVRRNVGDLRGKGEIKVQCHKGETKLD